MRILLDTNILLRSAKQDHPQYRGSVDAAELLRQRGHELLIVPQVLYEFWAVATRPVENNGLGMHPADDEGIGIEYSAQAKTRPCLGLPG